MRKFYPFFKRTFDVVISFISLLFLIVPFLIIGLIIKMSSHGPIFFMQKRLGRNGKVFTIVKFRTMVVGAEEKGVYSNSNDKRVTKFGKFLRNTSIDELPQLFNVFIGNMSLIGPRPPLTYHPWSLENYTPYQLKMFNVRPGITGYAQVNGRRNLNWDERIELNIWYSENYSFSLDVKIFFKTIIKVIKNENNEDKIGK